jgi:hypothetical protein
MMMKKARAESRTRSLGLRDVDVCSERIAAKVCEPRTGVSSIHEVRETRTGCDIRTPTSSTVGGRTKCDTC